MRNLVGAFVIALLCAVNVHAAGTPPATPEILYLRAQPSIPLFPAPSATAVPVRQMTPGVAVTVLGREAGFVNVRAPDGVQGWLRETDLTGVAPPGARVPELEREAARLRGDLAAAQEALRASEARLRQARQATASARESGADASAALEAENTALREQLAAANAEAAQIRARLAQIETEREAAREAAALLAARQPPADSSGIARFSGIELAAGAGGAIGVALLGAWLGAVTARRRLRRRYHGLEL